MNRTVTFPDGTIFSSSALSKIEIESIFQDVLCASLGIDITNSSAYSQVRAGWQTQGQPAFQVTDDVVFVRCESLDTEYARLRDLKRTDITGSGPGWSNSAWGTSGWGSSGGEVQGQVDTHTRAWRTCITVYGPNSLDNARAIVSSMLDVQYIDTLLASYNLYVNPSIEQPQRVPENFQGQWWERMDVLIEFNEQITETFTVGTVKTVVVTTYDKDGQLTTQTITV